MAPRIFSELMNRKLFDNIKFSKTDDSILSLNSKIRKINKKNKKNW